MMSNFQSFVVFILSFAALFNVYFVLQVLTYLNWKRKLKENRNEW